MNNLVKAGSGEYDDEVTLEEIENYLLDIFTKRVPRDLVHGFRSCKNYGLLDINTYFHCGDDTCQNCNFFKDFLDEEHKEDS